jgi:DNA invertase Pin-like site-specific DNA recombinase
MSKSTAIGIVRVSRVAGREGESFMSPAEQRERIEHVCKHQGWKLLEIHDELDVSGGTPLAKRKGLLAAIEAVEEGRANVIVAAYFDRLVRSLKVQAEALERIERAGGQVFAADVGQLTNGSAGQWLSSTIIGAMSEYTRRTAKERSGEAQRRAVERGIVPWPQMPLGLRRGEDGRLVPTEDAPIAARAVRMRADGASIMKIRAWLVSKGFEHSFTSTKALLESPLLVGEIRFGDLVNLEAHPPIVDRQTWELAQRTRVSRGRQAKSEHLLARLGVLRCASCGSRMVVSTTRTKYGVYPGYSCSESSSDCSDRAWISAHVAEDVVVRETKLALKGLEGNASMDDERLAAEAEAERTQDAYDRGMRNLADSSDEPVAKAQLAELRAARDEAKENLARFTDTEQVLRITAAANWDELKPEGRRQLIQAMIARAEVKPGRGEDRVTIERN